MARRYNRDSRGRFSSTPGGGSSRRSETQANNRRLVRAGEVYSGSGATRRARSATKQAKAEQVAIKATKAYQRRSTALASTGGARLGGKRKVFRPDPWQRALNVAKAADQKAGGGVKGTIAGVRASRRLGGMARIGLAAKRAGLGASKAKPAKGQRSQLARLKRSQELVQRATDKATYAKSRREITHANKRLKQHAKALENDIGKQKNRRQVERFAPWNQGYHPIPF